MSDADEDETLSSPSRPAAIVQPVDAQPQTVWMPGGVRTEIHLTGDHTADEFCLLIDEPPAGWSLPAHRHRGETETIHVIDGEFEIDIDGRQVSLASGQSIHIPAGVIHSGRNGGERPGRRPLMFSPAGMKRFFMEAGAATPEVEIDRAQALACALRYGWEFVAGESRPPRVAVPRADLAGEPVAPKRQNPHNHAGFERWS